jgi:hypothetical protein
MRVVIVDLQHLSKMLQCFLLDHRDIQVVLNLGKIVPERIEARKCERCNRILIPTSKLTGKAT